MSDGSTRIVSCDATYPTGTRANAAYTFGITASPGVHEQQPEVVPIRFDDTQPDAPAGYETIEAKWVFTYYSYDPESSLASWTADMEIENIKEATGYVNGDTEFFIND